ncbi:GRAS transcription factor [Parasponia andersonii]|uniref:GRAS transcription factor n=1 Tax=Parasponia andersonii TaxID=3476 RepID=A0A2P5D340_PARAD|nr:GRAS transcription factor [Parasponia andersonii]
MIVPVTTPQNNLIQSPNPKSDNNNNNSNNSNNSNNNNSSNIGFHSPARIPNLCNEPTSVLDLRRSSSPVAEKPAKDSAVSDVVLAQTTNDRLEWDDQVLHNLDNWDTIMRDLGLHDDSAPSFTTTSTTTTTTGHFVPQLSTCDPQIPHFPEFTHPQPFDPTRLVHSADFSLSEWCSNHSNSTSSFGSQNLNVFEVSTDFHLGGNNHNNNNNTTTANNNTCNIGFDFIEDLIRVADCFDSDDLQFAQVILDRLNNRLRSTPSGKPVGKQLQRAAIYFMEALQSLLSGSNRTARLSSWAEIVQTIRGYKAFSGISPIPMFSHFTSNQALLEALGGSAFIHVIDFDIGLGGQYASLMRELAEKWDSLRVNQPILRVTAVVAEEYAVESRLIRENLTQFAQELNIWFQVEFIIVRTFKAMSFKAVNFRDGEKTAVLFSSAVLRRLGGGFLGDVRRLSPAVAVFVDGDGFWGETGARSFRRGFVCGLEFYSMVMESLDAAMVGPEWIRKIEAYVLKPRIAAAVEAAAAEVGGGIRTASFREMFHGAGLRPVQLSQFADFQAECLLGKVQVRGFHVAKRQAELVLCWHERALVATSVWRC